MKIIKIVYIMPESAHSLSFAGVGKKIRAQIKMFEEKGINVQEQALVLCPKLLRVLPFTSASLNWNDIRINQEVDAVYIRYNLSDRPFIKMLKKIKKQNPKCKIIIEIPTYPYDKEQTLKQLPLIIKDRIHRKSLHKYVDRIVVFSDNTEIFGVPTIQTINGIDMNSVSPRKPVPSDGGRIHVIAVAVLALWHGYDRFIQGLGEYYAKGGNRDILFHVVGDGAVLSEYKQLVQQHDLSRHVIFYGNQTGQALDNIYDLCSMGIEILGCHRKGILLSSTLKSREYWAKGLPFITEMQFPSAVDQIKKYILDIPADESPVEIEQVIMFYEQIYSQSSKSEKQIIDEIRSFAQHTCDMSIAVQPVIDYIFSKNGKCE